MRCSGWSSLAISAFSALVLAAPASAHVIAVPPFVSAGDTASLSLTGPNERDEPMTGFEVTAKSEFRIVRAHAADGWDESAQASTASWTGGSLAPGDEATFSVELEAPSEPGSTSLEVAQRYPGGELVRWGVALTVTPASESSSQNLGWALVTAVVGVGVLVAIALAFLQRTRSLQEK